MRTSLFRLLSSLLVIFLGLSAAGAQTPVHWIGPTGTGGAGLWSTAANWSGGVVPNNGNGNTYSVTLPDYPGMFNEAVIDDMSPTVDSLTLESGNAPNYLRLVLTVGQTNTFTTRSVTNGGSISLDPGTAFKVNGNLTNTGNFYGNGGFVDVTGNVSNSGVMYLPPAPPGVNIGGTLNVIGDTPSNGFFEVGPGPGNVNAARYVQTGNYAYGTVVASTFNVNDAMVSGGEFDLFATMNGNLEVEGATFRGSRSNFNNYGVLNGNFTIDSSGKFIADISNCCAPSQPFAVSGDVSLAGTIQLNFPYGVPDGETFDIMKYSAETGQFGTVEWTGLYQRATVTLEYGPTELDAVVHQNSPEPISFFLMGTGAVLLVYRSRRRLATK